MYLYISVEDIKFFVNRIDSYLVNRIDSYSPSDAEARHAVRLYYGADRG